MRLRLAYALSMISSRSVEEKWGEGDKAPTWRYSRSILLNLAEAMDHRSRRELALFGSLVSGYMGVQDCRS